MNDIPEDIRQIIENIIPYEDAEDEENIESGLEYLYDWDYSPFPEKNEIKYEDRPTIIKIDL